jgi:hypothetical protein
VTALEPHVVGMHEDAVLCGEGHLPGGTLGKLGDEESVAQIQLLFVQEILLPAIPGAAVEVCAQP